MTLFDLTDFDVRPFYLEIASLAHGEATTSPVCVAFGRLDTDGIAIEPLTPDKAGGARRGEATTSPVCVAFGRLDTDGIAIEPFTPDKAGGARRRLSRLTRAT
jgi:hypothetical protein